MYHQAMDADLFTNPGFWVAIALVAVAWGFGSMLRRAGVRQDRKLARK